MEKKAEVKVEEKKPVVKVEPKVVKKALPTGVEMDKQFKELMYKNIFPTLLADVVDRSWEYDTEAMSYSTVMSGFGKTKRNLNVTYCDGPSGCYMELAYTNSKKLSVGVIFEPDDDEAFEFFTLLTARIEHKIIMEM